MEEGLAPLLNALSAGLFFKGEGEEINKEGLMLLLNTLSTGLFSKESRVGLGRVKPLQTSLNKRPLFGGRSFSKNLPLIKGAEY